MSIFLVSGCCKALVPSSHGSAQITGCLSNFYVSHGPNEMQILTWHFVFNTKYAESILIAAAGFKEI